MEVQELRIGNLVNHEQTTHVIKSIGGSRVSSVWIRGTDNDVYNSSIKHIKPIPLTEEWLVSFGFRRKEKIVNEDVYVKGSLGIFPDYNIVVYYVETCKDGSHTIPITLKYVHQLQNLFFCLCGEELTLSAK